jgi:hypothetical protein
MQKTHERSQEKPKRKQTRTSVEDLRQMDLDNPRHLEAIRWWSEFRSRRSKLLQPDERNLEPTPNPLSPIPIVVAQTQMLLVVSTRKGRAQLLKTILKSRGIERCGEQAKKKETCDRAKGHVLPHSSAEHGDRWENVDADYHAICRHYPALLLRLLETLGAPSPREMAIAIMGEFSRDT